MNKRRITIRVDERTAMLLDELASITGSRMSVIIRSMIYRSIEEIIDKSGNWKIKDARDKSKEGK